MHSDQNGINSGHVRVYEFNSSNSSWEQLGEDIDGEAASDLSGYSVSLSADGSVVAIGALFNDSVNGSNSGHVRVYEYDATKTVAQPVQTADNFGPVGWNRLGEDIDGEAASNFSGVSVSLSADGSIVAIGAMFNEGVNGIDSGHVRVYKYDATKTVAQPEQTSPGFGPVGWNRLGGDIDGEAASDFSGTSVSLSADGSIIAIGAKRNHGINGSDSGHVRVYQYDSTKTEAQLVNQTAPDFGPVGWNRLGKDIDGEAAESESGVSVSLSADATIVAIGANLYGNNRGRVTVYQYDPNKLDWLKVGKGIDGEADEDKFGISVSLSHDGSVLAIGAHKNDGINGIDSGHVRVFQIAKRNPWVQQGLDIDGEAAGDFSGRSVSLSADGSILAIGAHKNDGINGIDSGHVRVYQNNKGLWKQKGQDIDGEAQVDTSGWSVSLSTDGSIVAIGAIFNQGDNSISGHVRVYEFNTSNSSWEQKGDDIDGEVAGDASGISVSLSADGSVVAIGSINNGGNGNNSGHVRVYEYDATKNVAQPEQTAPGFGPAGWNRLGGDIDGEAAQDKSGLSVSLSADGSIVAIGAHENDGINGVDSGHVRVYQYDATKTEAQLVNQTAANYGPAGWNRLGQDIDGKAQGDNSGSSVSLSANGLLLAIGAYRNNGPYTGYVRLYEFDTVNLLWEQKGTDIDVEETDDEYSMSVSLNDNGTIVAIGASRIDNNGIDSGHVRIYEYINDTWLQIGADIDGETRDDFSGSSVSLNTDGSIVAIGAPENQGINGIDSGHVRVYKFNGWGLGSTN
jgi:hypothetical protein